MNVKRYVITSIVVWIVIMVFNFFFHGIILDGLYQKYASVFRTDMQSKMWLIYVGNIIFAFAFVFVFTKGYENKGIAEGFRYGLYLVWLIWLPAMFAEYAMYALPFKLVFYWFLGGLVEYIILGIVTAALYKPAEE